MNTAIPTILAVLYLLSVAGCSEQPRLQGNGNKIITITGILLLPDHPKLPPTLKLAGNDKNIILVETKPLIEQLQDGDQVVIEGYHFLEGTPTRSYGPHDFDPPEVPQTPWGRNVFMIQSIKKAEQGAAANP